MLMRLLAAGLLALSSPACRAAEAMRYVFTAPESPSDHRYDFHREVLRTALERTRAAWGPFTLADAPPMTEQRQTFELMGGTGRLTVMYLSTTPEYESRLVPVRIPVDKGLAGWFVLLARRADLPRLARVRTLEDLRAFRVGLGKGWLDIPVMEAAGLRVVTGSSYEGLFEMLLAGRFDVFPRSAVEVLPELDQRAASMPGLALEPDLLLHYPWPMYFWFSRNEAGLRLARRTEAGMRAMLGDGTYDRIFLKHHRQAIARLALGRRRLIRLSNPLLPPGTPLADRTLWFDPLRSR